MWIFSPLSKLKEGIGFTLGFTGALGVMFSKPKVNHTTAP